MQSSNCNKNLNFKNFSIIQIGVETRVDDLHSISRVQTQKNLIFVEKFQI